MKNVIKSIIVGLYLMSLVFLSPSPHVLANVKAQADYNAILTKSFSPKIIGSNEVSRLTVLISNPNNFNLINSTWTDNLPSGITIASTPKVTSDCAGTVTAVAGSAMLSLTRGFVAANGSCKVSVDVAANASGDFVNTIDAETFSSNGGSVSNTNPTSDTLTVTTYQYSAKFIKSFLPAYTSLGSSTPTTLSITISNPNTFILSNAGWTDTLPTGLLVAAVPNSVLTNCSSGSVTANPGESTISLSGASVPAKDGTGDGLCTVSVDVVAGQAGILTNTMGADSLTATGNGGTVSNPFPASAVLNVSTFNFSAEINKSFNPAIINPGETSTLSITIYNPNPFQLTNAAWVDHLDSIQPGITIAANPNIVNDMATGCGGIVSASPGGTSVSLNGGTVPAWVGGINGQCTISVDVTSTTQGNLTNTIPSGALISDGEPGVKIGNTDPASRTLRINPIAAPSVTKNFVQNTVWVEQNSRMTINIRNNDTGNSITETSLTDVLPLGVVLAGTVAESHSNCGSSVSVTAFSGTDMVIINNATILPNATCAVAVNVKSAQSDEYINHIDVGAVHTKQGVTNASIAEANLNVQAVGITKAFLPTTFQAGDTSVLTITLENRDTLQDYTDVYLKDTLPGTLEAVSATTDCINDLNDQTVDLSGTPLKVIELNKGKVAKAFNSSTPTKCYIYVTVTTPSGAVKTDTSYTNTIAKGVMTTVEGITNLTAANANVTVTPITIEVAKSFSPNRFQAGGSSLLTITLRNDTNKSFTNVGLVDVMPAGLLIKDSPAPSTTCAGSSVSVTYTNPPVTDPSEITLISASLPTGTSCHITATVTTDPGAATQNYNNTIPAEIVTSEEDVTNLTGTSSGVDIYSTGLGVTGSKSFNPTVVLAGVSSRLTIDLYAPADQTLHGFNATDTLPAGLTIYSTPNVSTSGCGVLATATAGDNKVELSGGTINAGALCRIQVNVTGTLPATYTNTIYPADIQNDEDQTLSQAITADLRITNLIIRKVFYPTIVSPNGLSTLTITLENTNDVALTNVSLTDSLNTMGNSTNGVIVAPIPNKSTTCGSGLVTAAAGSKTITMSGGTIPAKIGSVNGLCTILVDVQGKRTATSPPSVQFDNNIPVANVSGRVGTTGPIIQPELPATAPLTITNLVLGVVKGFDPLTVFGGTLSTLSITLDNTNNTVLTGLAFTDKLPAGMYIANPVDASTGTCGGILSNLPNGSQLDPGGTEFSYRGGVLAANKRCTITLNATMNVNGNRTNTIAALAVTSFNGAKNLQPASATLTNLPGASITKFFSPNSIVLGDTSLLTIRIKNTGNIPLTNIGLMDTLPAGLVIEALPVPDTTCNVSSTPGLTVDTVTRKIELVNGSLAAGPNTTCDITVTVSAVSPGSYTNTIPARTLFTNEDATNPDPASDTLTVNSTPDLQLVKTGILDMSVISPSTTAETGDKINYILVATNMGDVTLTNVTITDADPAIIIGTCTPAQPATLLKGETLSCPAVYTLKDADITNQLYSNTATVTSKLPDGVTEGPTDTDTENIPLNVPFSLEIKKVVTNIGPFRLNDTIIYSITATNLGLNSLSNVQVTDPGADVTLGTCLPAFGSTLASGESLVCSATHHVTTSDVNAGFFSNTAIADSTETNPPVTDTAIVPIKQNAKLEVFKEVISTGPYNAGSTITYDISAKNTGDQTLHNVIISDLVELPLDPNDPDYKVTLGACTPAQPADLEPNDILSCSATHVVTANNMLAGGFRNKAKATSDETGEVTDSAVVILKTPSIQLNKNGAVTDVNSNGRTDAGETIDYTFTITNNGQVTLTDIILTDIVGGVNIIRAPAAPDPLTLAPGESDSSTFTGTYTLTQADIDADTFTNIAIVTGFPPIGSPVSTSANHTENLAEPGIDLVKSEDHSTFSTPVIAGDNVSYTFTVENTGNVTLNTINLTDAKCNNGPNYLSGDTANTGKLDVTETWTYTCAHTLTQTDVDSGTLVNNANLTSKLPAGDTGPTDTDTKTVPLTAAPGIDLVKSEDHSTFSNPVMAGNIVNYSFTVENTGNVTLNTISLVDAKCNTGPTYQSGDTANSGNLDVTETWTYTCAHTLTQADVDSGTLVNNANLTSKLPAGDTGPTDTDTKTVPLTAAPGIDLVKSEHHSTFSNPVMAGNIVNYSFTIENTGNVTLNTISLVDAKCNTGPTYQSGDTANSGNLDVTETWTYTCAHTLTQADVDSGSLVNIATVTSKLPAGDTGPTDTDTKTVPLTAAPGIDLVKSEDHSTFSNPVMAGNIVNYSFTVENTGNVTLNTISLVDAKCNSGPTYQSGDTANTGLLDVTETWTYTCSHTLTQADIDDITHQIINTATVTSKLPAGDTGPTDTDTKTVALTAAPGIDLVKSEDHSTFSNPVMAGDVVSYSFTVENTGNVTLNSISLVDAKCNSGPTYQSGDTANIGLLDVTETWAYTCTHTLTLAEIDFGSITNTSDVSGKSPTNEVVNDTDEITLPLEASPLLGVAKRVVDSPTETSPGTWEVTFSFVVRNYGNVTLKNIQVTDNLNDTFVTPPSVITPTTYTVLSVTSTDFMVNWPAGYNGSSDINLLMGVGSDILEPGESGTITLKIEVIPSYGGPFLNSAVARGNPPSGDPVSDVSQDGIDPDPDPKDGDPTNNNDPTLIDFGPRMFDPPYGIKLLDRTLQPVLQWTMVWINDTNIVAVNAAASDPIPYGTVFEDNGIGSGYPLPPDPLPAGSIASGVSCEDTSGITTTKYCYYEGLTDKYPRGRIVWQGILGPDFSVTDPLMAVNEIQITFNVRLSKGVKQVSNTATIDLDLNGDGDPTDEGELEVASASLTYRNLKGLPRTGFAPGVLTKIPSQPNIEAYSEMNGMWLEIPSLGLKSAIVGVPMNEAGEWDVTWLGNQVGWLNGTAFPTWNGNSLLTAHVTDSNGKPGLFFDLGKMSWGNKILIHSWGQVYTYEVRSVNLWLSPDSISTATKHEELPWITLITCHDYNEKSDTYLWRTMIRAVLINVSNE